MYGFGIQFTLSSDSVSARVKAQLDGKEVYEKFDQFSYDPKKLGSEMAHAVSDAAGFDRITMQEQDANPI